MSKDKCPKCNSVRLTLGSKQMFQMSGTAYCVNIKTCNRCGYQQNLDRFTKKA